MPSRPSQRVRQPQSFLESPWEAVAEGLNEIPQENRKQEAGLRTKRTPQLPRQFYQDFSYHSPPPRETQSRKVHPVPAWIPSVCSALSLAPVVSAAIVVDFLDSYKPSHFSDVHLVSIFSLWCQGRGILVV